MSRRLTALSLVGTAFLLAAAAPDATPPLVAKDMQAVTEREGYAAYLYRDVAVRARETGFGVLATMLNDLAAANAERAAGHRHALGGDRLLDDLRAVAGVAIAQHEAYGRALQHARAVGDRQAAADFERLFAESARDRDALQTSINARLQANQ